MYFLIKVLRGFSTANQIVVENLSHDNNCSLDMIHEQDTVREGNTMITLLEIATLIGKNIYNITRLFDDYAEDWIVTSLLTNM